MVDTKISGFDDIGADIVGTDQLAVVDDPAGTPLSRRADFTRLLRYIEQETTFIKYVQPTVVDPLTVVTTGDGKWYMHVPPGLNGMNLMYVHAECITAGAVSGTMDVQIRNVTQAVDMLTTKLTIDVSETGSDTAAVAAVIDAANDDVATNDLLAIDIDGIHGTPAKGLIVTLGFQLP